MSSTRTQRVYHWLSVTLYISLSLFLLPLDIQDVPKCVERLRAVLFHRCTIELKAISILGAQEPSKIDDRFMGSAYSESRNKREGVSRRLHIRMEINLA